MDKVNKAKAFIVENKNLYPQSGLETPKVLSVLNYTERAAINLTKTTMSVCTFKNTGMKQ